MFKKFCYHLGYTLRETGQALDRYGCRLQGDYAFVEQLNRHRRVTGLYNKRPAIAEDVFIAPSASVIGQVNLSAGSSVWYGAVLRGDVNEISVGQKSSIGHRAVVHGTSRTAGVTHIGSNVIVGDSAIIHACTLQDNCVVESGAIVFDGAVVESNAIVGPGAVVTKGKKVGAGQYWEGNPAKHVRDVTQEEREQVVAEIERLYLKSKDHEDETVKKTPRNLYEDDQRRTSYTTHHPNVKVSPAVQN